MTGGARLRGPIELATSTMTCWRCRRDTFVVALIVAGVVEDNRELADLVTNAPCIVGEAPTQGMPKGLKIILQRLAPNFRPLLSRSLGNVAWRNACLHCNSALSHVYLHEHLTGPFFGRPSTFAGVRETIWQHDMVVDDHALLWRGPHDFSAGRIPAVV